MGRSDAVWAIDIGNSSLKALRCRPHDSPDRILADAFDYIEYPKILTQPGAETEELVANALKQFLSRNQVRGDKVSISVPGQNGLARFIKLPPVESRKIPDIVRYEARQQIPFDLKDVIWDFQRMGGGSEEDGFALETEVGLFAMKRDQVFKALEPLRGAGIEVDFVQLAPLALYNYAFFDLLYDLPPIDEFDPENPPPSLVILSMGTDATDMVVTNGYRVWQRSIPLGGNHFTKALTKELKLTFAKAEHLKRNATAAEDPKAVFTAMRPIFNDLLTEIQRSLNFFTSLDRNAKIGQVVTLGNAMKLPGLRRYLAQSLGYDVAKVEAFRGLVGPEVVSSPAFKENLLSFGVCYGLALQGVSKGALRTNLLPREIVQDRLVREKKPWAVASVAVLLMAMTISFVSYSRALGTVALSRWENTEREAEQVHSGAQRLQQSLQEEEKSFDTIDQIGKNLVSNVEGRVRWLELMKTLNASLPPLQNPRPSVIEDREELHVINVEVQRLERVEDWVNVVKQWYRPSAKAIEAAKKAGGAAAGSAPAAPGAPSAPAASPAPAPAAPAGAATAGASGGAAGGNLAAAWEGPKGPGWIVQLTGYHDHNRNTAGLDQGAEYVRKKLIERLEGLTLALPTGQKDEDGKDKLEVVSAQELGLSYPVLVDPGLVNPMEIEDPNSPKGVRGAAAGGVAGGVAGPKKIKVRRFDFVVQFCWQPKLPSERRKAKEHAADAQPQPGASN
jgi:type IV pilus assembly protein PilM